LKTIGYEARFMLLSAEHLSFTYGDKPLLEDASLYLNPGGKLGIIGVNGTGKSTLLRILSGRLAPDKGIVSRNPNVQASVLEQNPVMHDEMTVLEQIFAAFPPEFRALKEYEAVSMLTRLGIPDVRQKIGALSGGQRKRVALAAALVHPADILILDEPTNHLDSDMILWLEQRLIAFSGGIVMVTHDRYFLERVVTGIAELTRGRLVYYDSNYSHYLERKSQAADMAEASERKRQAVLRREYQWVIRGCQARTTKSKERLERYENLKNQQGPQSDGTVQMAAMASRLGKKIVSLENVSFAYPGRPILRDFSCRIGRNDRIGVVGRNGAGKSTLLNLLAGRLSPQSGAYELGSTVKIGYFTQEGRELDPNQTRLRLHSRAIAAEVQTDEGTFTASQMLERFLFEPALQFTPIGRLSGGERRRLYLLSILMAAPNLLLLDEPTNDLDITTLSILEDYLDSFPGPVIAVAHDRYFLDRLAEEIWEVQNGGEVAVYTGNFSDYLRKRPAPEPEKPKAAAPKIGPATPAEGRRSSASPSTSSASTTTIEQDVASLEQEIARCEKDAEAACSDYVRLQALTEEKAALEARLSQKMDRWVYLSDLAEKDRGAGTKVVPESLAEFVRAGCVPLFEKAAAFSNNIYN
jgi:ATP-binding cassette subfamily F protein uup